MKKGFLYLIPFLIFFAVNLVYDLTSKKFFSSSEAEAQSGCVAPTFVDCQQVGVSGSNGSSVSTCPDGYAISGVSISDRGSDNTSYVSSIRCCRVTLQ